MKQKTKTIRQVVAIRTAPEEIYAVLMDSRRHAKLIGASARISRRVGGKFTAYDGWLEGKNLALTPGKKIVQTWRGSDWEEDVFSKLTISLAKTARGARLTMVHSGVPASEARGIAAGWKKYYWVPLRRMFEK